MNKIVKKILNYFGNIFKSALRDRGTVLLSRHCISSFMTRSDTNYRNGVVDVLLDDFW